MSKERNHGVSEARYALTLLFCVLVGMGFLLLNQLSGTANAPPIETRPAHEAGRLPPDTASADEDEPPRVLVIESGEPAFPSAQWPNNSAPSYEESTNTAHSPAPQSQTERR